MMQMGRSRACPLGYISSKPNARGPLLCVFFFPYCARRTGTAARLTARQMTAQPALRYNDVRSGVPMNTNDKAPEFTLPDENGQNVSLKDSRGKNVVLFFFPKADTPG